MSAAFRVFLMSSLKEGVSPDAYRELGDRTVAMVRAKEPGTVVYDWWIGDDGSVVNVDGYADEAAFSIHGRNMTESGLRAEFRQLLDITSVLVLGDVGATVRDALAALGPVHFSRVHTL